jgi:hypothetical protein
MEYTKCMAKICEQLKKTKNSLTISFHETGLSV